jgi:hypothetical protein
VSPPPHGMGHIARTGEICPCCFTKVLGKPPHVSLIIPRSHTKSLLLAEDIPLSDFSSCCCEDLEMYHWLTEVGEACEDTGGSGGGTGLGDRQQVR